MEYMVFMWEVWGQSGGISDFVGIIKASEELLELYAKSCKDCKEKSNHEEFPHAYCLQLYNVATQSVYVGSNIDVLDLKFMNIKCAQEKRV